MSFISRPNSWVSRDDAATTQLTYALQLNPAPLTVSISGRDPILGSLQFVVSNPTAYPISVNSVAFTIQVGTDSTDLTPTTATIGTSVNNNTDWQIVSPGSIITSGPATYTLQPQTAKSVVLNGGASVVVEIFDFPTVENPGNTTITVKETVDGKISFTSFLVTTFPAGFFFDNLIATAVSGSQLQPVAQVAAGSTVTLIWNSSVTNLASFIIYYSSASQGQQQASPSDTGSWTSPPLASDTVFTVMVTVSITGGEPLSAALSTTVSIQNPNLVANSLTASNVTATNSLTAATITATTSLTAGNITALGVIDGFGTVPIGAILDWWAPANSKLTPPANFVICDGRLISDPASPFNGQNTPNLVKSFIYGVNNFQDIGKSGGSSTANVSITSQFSGQTSAITNSVPSSANTGAATIIRNNPSNSYRFSMAGDNVGWNDGQHVHNFSGSSLGSASITTIPPFVCLLKIVRIK
jgi:hypothetical protein